MAKVQLLALVVIALLEKKSPSLVRRRNSTSATRTQEAEPLEKKELVQLYEALKLVCDTDKMNVEVRTEEGRLFLSKRQ